MKNLTEFCKTVETGVDPRLRRISINYIKIGGAGFRTPDLPHAKRTLYHWATPPASHLNAGNLRIDPNILNFRTHWGFSYNCCYDFGPEFN